MGLCQTLIARIENHRRWNASRSGFSRIVPMIEGAKADPGLARTITPTLACSSWANPRVLLSAHCLTILWYRRGQSGKYCRLPRLCWCECMAHRHPAEFSATLLGARKHADKELKLPVANLVLPIPCSAEVDAVPGLTYSTTLTLAAHTPGAFTGTCMNAATRISAPAAPRWMAQPVDRYIVICNDRRHRCSSSTARTGRILCSSRSRGSFIYPTNHIIMVCSITPGERPPAHLCTRERSTSVLSEATPPGPLLRERGMLTLRGPDVMHHSQPECVHTNVGSNLETCRFTV
nr:hypothetical protein CFP56_63526 [Quercus suber]